VQPTPSRAAANGVKMRPPELPSAAMAGTVLKFDNADIYEVLQAVLGEMLHLNYIVDPSIQGKVTINTQGAVSQADLFTLLESVLSLNNLSILRDGKVYKVVKDANAPRDTLTFEALGEGSPLIQIIGEINQLALVNTLRIVGPQAGIVSDPWPLPGGRSRRQRRQAARHGESAGRRLPATRPDRWCRSKRGCQGNGQKWKPCSRPPACSTGPAPKPTRFSSCRSCA
jgi:hypothetical protein